MTYYSSCNFPFPSSSNMINASLNVDSGSVPDRQKHMHTIISCIHVHMYVYTYVQLTRKYKLLRKLPPCGNRRVWHDINYCSMWMMRFKFVKAKNNDGWTWLNIAECGWTWLKKCEVVSIAKNQKDSMQLRKTPKALYGGIDYGLKAFTEKEKILNRWQQRFVISRGSWMLHQALVM